MGRFVYWMNVSLDMMIEGKPGEQGGGSWMRISEEMHREINRRARMLTMGIEGRVIHEIMESFWPAAASDPSQPDFMREYGEIWTKKPKILVSRSRKTAAHNTRIVGGSGDEALDELARVRATTEGDIGVGGATLATQLLKRGLLDELFLFTHPVYLGTGRALFDDVAMPVECDLLEHAQFPEGVTLNRYSVRGAK